MYMKSLQRKPQSTSGAIPSTASQRLWELRLTRNLPTFSCFRDVAMHNIVCHKIVTYSSSRIYLDMHKSANQGCQGNYVSLYSQSFSRRYSNSTYHQLGMRQIQCKSLGTLFLCYSSEPVHAVGILIAQDQAISLEGYLCPIQAPTYSMPAAVKMDSTGETTHPRIRSELCPWYCLDAKNYIE